ncbi:MAG: hypothetical protein ACK4VI_00835 [Alphaproteobacteria bacterium]
MLKIFSFFRNETKNLVDVKNDSFSELEKPIENYLFDEIKASDYVKSSGCDTLIQHLTHKINLFKDGNLLTNEEKKSLGLNVKMNISWEFVNLLTSDGLNLKNPKFITQDIYNRAWALKRRDDSFYQAIRVGVKKFTLNECGDESECEWCKSVFGHEFDVSILEIIKENCKCVPYSKAFIAPVIEFQK